MQGPRPMTGRIVHAERVAETLPAPHRPAAADGAAHPRHHSRRRRPAPVRAGGGREHPGHRSRPARAHRPGARIAAPRGEPEHAPHHAAQHRQRPSHRACRLRRRGAAVEGDVPSGAAGEGRRSRAPAGLGGAGEPVRRRLERHRADAAIRQPGHVPSGDLSELLRAAARGAGGDPRPHPAECGHARAAGGAADAEGSLATGRCRRMLAAPAPPPAPAPMPQRRQVDGAGRGSGTGRRRRGGDDLPASHAGGACRRPYRQRADHRSQHPGRARRPCHRRRHASAVGDPHHQRHRRHRCLPAC